MSRSFTLKSPLWESWEKAILIGLSLALPTSIALTNVLLVIGLLLVILKTLSGKGRRWTGVGNWGLILVIFILWDGLACFLSGYPPHLIEWLEDRWVLMGAVVAYYLLPTPSLGLKLLRTMVVIGSAVALLSAYQHYFGWDPVSGVMLGSTGKGFAARGTFNHHLTYGGSAMLIALMALCLVGYKLDFFQEQGFPGKRFIREIVIILTAILTALGLFFSMARSALLGYLTGAAVWLWYLPRHLKRVTLIVLGVALIGMVLAVPGVFMRFAQIVKGGNPNESTRKGLWGSAVEVIQHHPLWGVGQGNWREAFERYASGGYYVSTAHPHNDYLSVAVDGGLPSLALFLLLWLFYGVKMVHQLQNPRTSPEGKTLALTGLISVIGILIGGLFQNYQSDAEVASLLWFIVGLSIHSDER
ncbi:MAG: O-antigen ligase family protein [bacterium]